MLSDDSLFASCALPRSNVSGLMSLRESPVTEIGKLLVYIPKPSVTSGNEGDWLWQILRLNFIMAALTSRISPSLNLTTYSDGSSSFPCHTIGPFTAGGSLSGELRTDEVLLCRLSKEDLVLRGGDNMVD